MSEFKFNTNKNILNLFWFLSTKSFYKDIENRPKFGPLEHNIFSGEKQFSQIINPIYLI